MRWRLFLAFTLIIVITLGIFGALIRQRTFAAVETFAQRGGFIGADRLVADLENYYHANQTWEGVEALFQNEPFGAGEGEGNRRGPMMGAGPGFAKPGYVLVDPAFQALYSNLEDFNPQDLSEDVLARRIPLNDDGQVVGYLLPAQNSPDPEDIRNSTFSSLLQNALLLTILIAGFLALGFSVLLAYFLLRPVNNLTAAANQLAAGDLSQRVPVRGDDELSTLARTFNHMAASLEKVEANRRALTADIAHELRTPLAVQRANLEALQDGVYPLTQDNLAAILDQNKLLTQLVEDLRTLAQADSDTLELEIHPVNPEKFFSQIVENFQPQAAKRNLRLTMQVEEPCPSIDVDARRINQVVNNLLDNAFQHTPDGGEITLTVACRPNSFTLTVHDTGPGIPPDALPHIFDRFFRADQSRARIEGGSGLGLTIARRLVQAHGGALSAANHPEGGAVFTLTLPL